VVGEVNNGEDKPKLFPQEIMPLEDAPRKYTLQVHLRLNAAHLQPQSMDEIGQLVQAHAGKCPLFLCLKRAGGQIVFVEAHEKYGVAASMDLQRAVDEKFGEETYYAKVDTSLPERERRRWEKRPDGGGEE
jgi:hypothetical protein